LETVYLVGAGINRSLRSLYGLTPPLAKDFLQLALKHPRVAPLAETTLRPLLEFIARYWHLEREKLLTDSFDLEECFTIIELRRRDAELRGDLPSAGDAWQLMYLLTNLLLEYLSDFHHLLEDSPAFLALGRRIYDSRAAVLTFNYDTLLEDAIEMSSPANNAAVAALEEYEYRAWEAKMTRCTELRRQGMSEEEVIERTNDYDEVAEAHIAYSRRAWDPIVAYAIQFDEVQLRLSGLPRTVLGPTYYGHPNHNAEHPPFLKLHGSLGWWVHTGNGIDGLARPEDLAESRGRTVIQRRSVNLGVPSLTPIGEFLAPLVITPVLFKSYAAPPFVDLWEKALGVLRGCGRLVVGGYSFPPTDFNVRRLLREAFSDHSLDDLCVINPDTSVVAIARELCNHQRPVLVCRDVQEFVEIEF
jgi:hypothetical protein